MLVAPFDAAPKRRNSKYEAKRESGRYDPLVIRVVRREYDWHRRSLAGFLAAKNEGRADACAAP
jgi:hypothetical protein